jgi:hypothetical protein
MHGWFARMPGRKWRLGEPLALGGLAVVLLLAASVPPAGAMVTIGSNLAQKPNSSADYTPRPTFSNVSLPSDHRAPEGLSSPVNGTVVQWRIRVGDSTGATNFRIIRPLPGGLFTGAGSTGSVTPPIDATSSYAVQRPMKIKIGDYIGLDSPESPGAEFFVAGGAAIRNEWQPRLADGSPGHPPLRTNPYEIAINAEIDPTSTFTIDAIKRNKRRGTATLTVTVPNPGELTGAGRGVKVADEATVSKQVRKPGSVKLLIKAKGRKKRKLNSTGKVKVKPKITFTPTGGDPTTEMVRLKLKKL